MGDRGFDISARGDAGAAPRDQTHHLFLIGIDEYVHFPPLYNAVKDARDLEDMLCTRYTFEKERTTRLYNGDATRDNILSQLKKHISSLSPSDNLVLYFAGHGHYKEDVNSYGYLIPWDAEDEEDVRCISYREIIDRLANCRARDILLIVDACFSGSVFNTLSGSYQRREDIGARWLLTAGRLELVSDGKPGDNSPFARSLMRHLRENATPALDSEDLFAKIKKDLKTDAKQQPRGESIQSLNPDSPPFIFSLRHAHILQEAKERQPGPVRLTRLMRRRVDRQQPVGDFQADLFVRRQQALSCQHYFLRAPSDELPQYLVDRLILELRQETNQHNRQNVVLYEEEKDLVAVHEFPQHKNLNFSKIKIKEAIAKLFGPSVDSLDELLLHRPNIKGADYAVRVFRIGDVRRHWHSFTPQLLEWVIGEFCRLERSYDTTFLLFYIFHEEESDESGGFLNRLLGRKAPHLAGLENLAGKFSDICTVLPKLNNVPQQDFLNWMDDHRLLATPVLRERFIRDELNNLDAGLKKGFDSGQEAFTMKLIDHMIWRLEQVIQQNAF